MHDYKIMVHDGKKYRPVADILPNGKPVWATSVEDRLKWFGLTRQELAVRKARLFERFPNIKFSIRKL